MILIQRQKAGSKPSFGAGPHDFCMASKAWELGLGFRNGLKALELGIVIRV